MVLVLGIMLIMLMGCSWIILDDTSLSNVHEGELTTSWDVTATVDNGDDWLDVPDEAEIGDRFTGSSGAIYELEEENLSPEEEAYYNENGLSADGVWVEIGSMSNN